MAPLVHRGGGSVVERSLAWIRRCRLPSDVVGKAVEAMEVDGWEDVMVTLIQPLPDTY